MRSPFPQKATLLATVVCVSVAIPTTAWAAPAVNEHPSRPVADPSVELVIETREPLQDGELFGESGAYERLRGHVLGELDPDAPANAGIVDLDKAPVNDDGMVEYSVDIEIHKPVDADKGNGTLLYEAVNRGRQLMLGSVNGADSLLYEEGFTVVWTGWQGDIPGTETTLVGDFPIATDAGEPIVELVRAEFVDQGTGTWTGDLPYPAATLDRAVTGLSVRERESDPRRPIESWRYLDDRRIEVTSPGEPYSSGAIFEFIYPAKDPIVLGMGFAATRDINSYLRSGDRDSAGNPNPLGVGSIDDTIALGISQSGRFLRDFVYQGFNEDIAGSRVFDGVMPIIAGSRKIWLNDRFAQVGWWSKQHEQHLQEGDQFPFAYGTVRDPLTGREDGILDDCTETDTCPKVVHVDGEYELWGARGSLLVTDGDPAGPRDLEQPAAVRLYLVAGTPHGGADRILPETEDRGICQQVNSPLGNSAVVRALLLRLDGWVAEGVEPPASRYGSVDGRLLVPAGQESTGFPEIPGVTYNGLYNHLAVTDYDAVPPITGAEYGVLVPRVDEDGNALAGIRLPAIEAPLATYTGWNLRAAGHAEGEMCPGAGSFIPLPETRSQRLDTGDPRTSITERYRNYADYVHQFSRAADALVADGHLRPEDAATMVAEADALRLVP
ncbi:alpha/beta hydrolase domain-containing protein [Modestobacter marinus]|uniref:Alpha/beta hydrolase domain-containing protein n=1 Tax=Modestobacter marinus TaxID=477641 RepID=A0ABQ2G394_9ACTN|nr:hypothetical protein GCM10011589_31180 [Modestobacter marinus]